MAATEGTVGPAKGAVRAALAAACGLLGVGGSAAEATEVKTAALGYSEQDRVQAFEAVVDVNHEFSGGKTGTVRFVFDALTGASPNGGVPSSGFQVFTRPSGRGTYTTNPGQTPLDDTFRDTRAALSGSVTVPLDRTTNLTGGLYGSGEHDYTSLGANLSLARDFDKRNTTVALRAGYFDDSISPEGGRPVPFSVMLDGALSARLGGQGNKDTIDLGAGVTQVIDPRTVANVTYTFSRVSGYITDPYKILTEVDPTTGAPDQYLYEGRPDLRNKHALVAKVVRRLGPHDLQLSYRYFTDDWGIQSHTFDFHFRWNASPRFTVQPRLRYYHQTAADFYRRYLVTGETLPAFASADYRLGDLDDYTPGLELGWTRAPGQRITLRGEYFLQTGRSHPAGAIGELADFDLFPTVKAVIVQVGYTVEL